MKKGLTMLIAAMVIFGAIGTVAAQAGASNVEVGSTLEIVGIGTMDRDLLAQSEWGYNGQRLTETMYSRWMGTDGLSNVSYSSDLNVYIGASDTHEDENTTEISYGQTAVTSNMKQKVCSQNYEAGVVSGFKLDGMSGRTFEIGMAPDSNYIEFEGAVDGSAVLKHMVVDPTSRLKVVKEVTRLDGRFDIAWDAFGEKLVYPGDEGDWLGCP